MRTGRYALFDMVYTGKQNKDGIQGNIFIYNDIIIKIVKYHNTNALLFFMYLYRKLIIFRYVLLNSIKKYIFLPNNSAKYV